MLFKAFKREVTLPRALNDYLVRKAIRANALYSTRDVFESWNRRANPSFKNGVIVHTINDDIKKKMEACVSETGREMTDDDIQPVNARLAGCLERDVETYYMLFEPKGERPFYVRYDNPAFKGNPPHEATEGGINANKVAALDFAQYTEYYDTKLDNTLFTIFGIGLLASTAAYTYDHYKNGFSARNHLLYYASFGLPLLFVPFKGPAVPLAILGVMFVPQLCAEAARVSNALHPIDVYAWPLLDAVALPITYFLFRSNFQSALARGLFAATFVFAGDFLYTLRKNNSQGLKRIE